MVSGSSGTGRFRSLTLRVLRLPKHRRDQRKRLSCAAGGFGGLNHREVSRSLRLSKGLAKKNLYISGKLKTFCTLSRARQSSEVCWFCQVWMLCGFNTHTIFIYKILSTPQGLTRRSVQKVLNLLANKKSQVAIPSSCTFFEPISLSRYF